MAFGAFWQCFELLMDQIEGFLPLSGTEYIFQ
jgi:hypothetical protein